MPDLPAPPGWAWVKLTDIARLETGHTPSREFPRYWNGDIPWIGIRDAREHHGAMIVRTQQQVTQEGIDNSAARVLPAGTVCLSRTASVGYVVVMGRAMATSQDFVNWICSEALEPHFLKYLLIAERESLDRFSKGSTHSTIYFPEVKALHICIPGIVEQRRIVAKLDKLVASSRAARVALDAVPAQLEQYRQSVLASAFRGDLTAEWRSAHPHVLNGDALLASLAEDLTDVSRGRRAREKTGVEPAELPQLPESWRWVEADQCTRRLTVGHVGPMQTRYTPDGVPFLRSQNVRENRIDPAGLQFIPQDFHRELAKSALSPGDVVIVRSGAPGVAAVVPLELPDANCADLVIARFSSLINPELIVRFINSQQCRQRIFDRQVGVAQQHFNVGAMRTLPIPVMPFEEQEELLRILREHEETITRVRERVDAVRRQLTELDAAALAKAFRGELAPQDPNDEPADLLLARLRAAQADAPSAGRRRRATARP